MVNFSEREATEMKQQKKIVTTVIVDDELKGIDALKYMIDQNCPNIEIIATYQSSIEALKGIKKLQPELLFLDIQMPNINGLELLDILGPIAYNTIFVTAHDEYMLQALRLSALDYLKKPVNEEELMHAIDRLQPNIKINQTQIKKAIAYIDQGYEINRHTPFGIKEGNVIKFIKLSEISYCKSDGNFTRVYLTDGTNIYSSYSLFTIEEKLPSIYFFRCHREYLVNGLSIEEYDRADGGSLKVSGNKSIPISRGRREDFKHFINTFI